MAPLKNKNPRNPTVQDESEIEGNGHQGAEYHHQQPVSWPEIFSQHESSLKSHLNVLNMVKGHVISESEAFRTISSMLDRTRELVEQFEVIRKQFMPNGVASHILSGTYTKELNNNNPAKGANGSRPENAPPRAPSEPLNSQNPHPSTKSKPSFVSDSRPTPAPSLQSDGTSKKKSRKRSRTEIEAEEDDDNDGIPTPGDQTDTTTTTTTAATSGHQKRRRTQDTIPGGDEHVENIIPAAMETEDISEEVERRLKIREERRRKRNAKPEKKRKRESTNSNASDDLDSLGTAASASSSLVKPKKKKAKVEVESNDTGGNSGSAEVNGDANANSHSGSKGEEERGKEHIKRSASHRSSTTDGQEQRAAEEPDSKSKKRRKE